MTSTTGGSNNCFEPLRRKRTKSDWAGVHLGDAFRNNIDFLLRAAAQRSFYRIARKVQKTVAVHTGFCESTFVPAAKPQIAPCYTTYPSVLAAHAAIGLTGYLEFKARIKENLIETYIGPLDEEHDGSPLARLLSRHGLNEVPGSVRAIAPAVIDAVQTRLLLEELSRLPSASFIESYRLFSASQHTLLFLSVPEIVRTVVLYGDVLPDLAHYPLHPLTRSILRDLMGCSASHFESLPAMKENELLLFGLEWVKNILLHLMPCIVQPEERKKADIAPSPMPRDPQPSPPLPLLLDPEHDNMRIAFTILNESLGKVVTNQEKSKSENGLLKAATELIEAVTKAAGQNEHFEDMRSDIVEHALRHAGWEKGPMEGNPVDGHSISVRLGDHESNGEQFEQALPLSEDVVGLERLKGEAEPVAHALRDILYPNITQLPLIERFCTSGSIDPMRLAAAYHSDAIYRRTRVLPAADRKGSPVLLIACDGSGSLNASQIHMLKILTAAWLQSTARTGIQMLAGLYHGGQVRQGISGPLVEWMYHPRKTPAISRLDSIRTLVGLPETGKGVQSDALSLAFMLSEAKALAKNGTIYLIVLSDCEWNRSFSTDMTGKEEVRSFFESSYKEMAGRLHTTLVGLGVSQETGFEELLDRVIPVSAAELGNSTEVAKKIGLYVASCLKERRNALTGRAI